MRLRKPRKLGVSVVSWLRHDGFDWEWTACTWRYFSRNALLNSAVVSAEPLARVSEGVVEVVSTSWVEIGPRRVTPLLRGVSMLVDPTMVDVVVSMLVPYFNLRPGIRVRKKKTMSGGFFADLHLRRSNLSGNGLKSSESTSSRDRPDATLNRGVGSRCPTRSGRLFGIFVTACNENHKDAIEDVAIASCRSWNDQPHFATIMSMFSESSTEECPSPGNCKSRARWGA